LKADGFYQMVLTMKANSKIISQMDKEYGTSKIKILSVEFINKIKLIKKIFKKAKNLYLS